MHLGNPQLLEHIITMHVRQVQIEQYDVIIIKLAEIEPLFAQVRGINVETFGRQHQLNRFCGRRFIFNQQHAHQAAPFSVFTRPRSITVPTRWHIY